MQGEMNKIFDQMHGQLDKQTEEYKDGVKKQAQRLVEIKKENVALTDTSSQKGSEEHEEAVVVDDWEIDYEEDK